MPDVHWDKGATVGSVIPTVGAIIPAAVGVDIGCGMMAVRTSINAGRLPDSLAAIRSAIDDDRTGPALESLVAALEASGWERGGDLLKTAPRGYDKDHPRIGLLRHRSLTLSRSYGFPPEVHTPELLEWVRRDWREGRPLMEWIGSVSPE